MSKTLTTIFFTILLVSLLTLQIDKAVADLVSDCMQKCTDEVKKNPSFNVQLCYSYCMDPKSPFAKDVVKPTSDVTKCLDKCSSKQKLYNIIFYMLTYFYYRTKQNIIFQNKD
ncbi:PREDICTED: uncharacterized protein LOC105367653 [Ceratosolen solmsi marchali]|uniref:Uncharacterized protein LOC105367653 n=1 Tax=Ceratosolen solmsi marchali TaxID=326594 RepID=A0AAJ6YUQ8_9HYME|nr:PREDICTED: uncharacterized protein LOC105367653 [Ceratosolen solmsi marchali]